MAWQIYSEAVPQSVGTNFLRNKVYQLLMQFSHKLGACVATHNQSSYVHATNQNHQQNTQSMNYRQAQETNGNDHQHVS